MFWTSSRIVIFFCSCSFALAADGPIAVTYRFEIVEQGGFHLETHNQMEPEKRPPEATACAAFGGDCSEAEAIKPIIVSHNQNGEEHSGIIRAPVNYEICMAKIDWENAFIDGMSTFNTRIEREPQNNGLGFYAVVPKNRPEGHSVKATFYLEFVPAGTTNQYSCWPTNVYPWLAKGANNVQFYPGARL